MYILYNIVVVIPVVSWGIMVFVSSIMGKGIVGHTAVEEFGIILLISYVLYGIYLNKKVKKRVDKL